MRDGAIDCAIMDQLCTVFEGACNQVRLSRRRPRASEEQLFTAQELEWFSKNSYNISLKHCGQVAPKDLVRLLTVCIEVIDWGTPMALLTWNSVYQYAERQ